MDPGGGDQSDSGPSPNHNPFDPANLLGKGSAACALANLLDAIYIE